MHRSIAYALLLCVVTATTGCRFNARVYNTPPVEGVVVDLGTREPVDGASVYFDDYPIAATTDGAGQFTMAADYNSRLVQVLLPGSASVSLPVFASHPDGGMGVAWAPRMLKALDQPPTAHLLIILFDEKGGVPVTDCSMTEDERLAIALAEQLMKPETQGLLVTLGEEYPEHANLLYRQLLLTLYTVANRCDVPGLDPDAIASRLAAMDR